MAAWLSSRPRALWLALLATALFAGVEIYAASRFPLVDVVDLIFDDAYFYLGVAFSIANGQGSKFREPLMTNGYQPLWLLLLALTAGGLRLGKTGLFVAAITLGNLAKVGGIACCALCRHKDYWFLGLGLFVSITLWPEVFSIGLETTLLALGAPLFFCLQRVDSQSARHAVAVGVGFALLFLVRLDCGALFLAHVVFELCRRRCVTRQLVLRCVAFSAIVLLYFSLNVAVFGVPVPVSGLAKRVGGDVGDNFAQFWSYVAAARYLTYECLTLCLTWFLARKVLPRNEYLFGCELAVLLLAFVFVGLYYGLFSSWPLWDWYYWPLPLVGAFTCAGTFKILALAWRARAGLSTAQWTLIGVVNLCVAAHWLDNTYGVATEESELIAALARNVLPEDAEIRQRLPSNGSFNKDNLDLVNNYFGSDRKETIAMGDRAGGLGYWLPEQHELIHLEGLVGSSEFIQALNAGTGKEYVDALEPTILIVDREHLLLHADADQQIYGVPEPIQGISTKWGLMLFCFPSESLLYSRNHSAGPYQESRQLIFDYQKQVACPDAITQRLAELTATPGALRAFSLPSED